MSAPAWTVALIFDPDGANATLFASGWTVEEVARLCARGHATAMLTDSDGIPVGRITESGAVEWIAVPAPDLSVLGATWPSDPRARRVLLSALRAMPDRGPWRRAVAWAFARCHSDALRGASIAAVCTELGVSRATLFAWRREDAEVGALPAARVKRAPGTVVKGDTREARAARRKSTRENA